MMDQAVLHSEAFSRYEFKYLLSAAQRSHIEEEIGHFMPIDGYAKVTDDNQYFVRSLYFDSPNAVNFHEKIDGVRTRRKYRLRTYVDTAQTGAPVFLEVKGRHNERTYKERVALDWQDVALCTEVARHAKLLRRYSATPLIEAFVYDATRKRLRPRLLVDYRRRPYSSHYDMNFRITFDAALKAAPATELFPTAANRFRAGVAGWTVLEIKFNRRVPAWFHRILQVNDMRRVSISKFVVGMKTCGLAVDLS